MHLRIQLTADTPQRICLWGVVRLTGLELSEKLMHNRQEDTTLNYIQAYLLHNDQRSSFAYRAWFFLEGSTVDLPIL